MQSTSIEKVWFVLSLTALSFGYGFVSHAWGLFPKSYVEKAWKQAQNITGVETDSKLLASQVYNRNGVSTIDSMKVQPGMTLLVSSWKWGGGDLRPGAKLIDRQGHTIHTWQPDRDELFPDPVGLKNSIPNRQDFHGSYLLPGGDLILLLSYIGAVRINACGDVLWRLEGGNHHAVARSEDGTFWMPGTSSERRMKTSKYPNGFPGINKPVWVDQMIHVTEDGDVIDKINVLDVIYNNDLGRYLVKGLGPLHGPLEVSDDPAHLNDIEPLSSSMAKEYPLFDAEDLLVSLRVANLIFVFDPDSGDVKWHTSHPFIHQHDPDFVGDGWIRVFDNNTDLAGRGKMLGGSRIIALKPHTNSTKVLFPTRQSDPFYTRFRGKQQSLENENMLLTEARAGRVVEIDTTGRTVWEWIHKSTDDSKVPIVTKASRHALTREDVASWPCSSSDSSTQKQQLVQ
jgi:hypothetical protein